jgi:hypothetical protein
VVKLLATAAALFALLMEGIALATATGDDNNTIIHHPL